MQRTTLRWVTGVWGTLALACASPGAWAQPWQPIMDPGLSIRTVPVETPVVAWTPAQEKQWIERYAKARAQGPFQMLHQWIAPPPQKLPEGALVLPALPLSARWLNPQHPLPKPPPTILGAQSLRINLVPAEEEQPPRATDWRWSYQAPCWYVWRERADVPPLSRAWGPERATGAPDTMAVGDIQTAWASRTQDGASEWLLLEFDEAIVPAALRVYETYNLGSIERITLFALDGSEVEVRKGDSPQRQLDAGIPVLELRFGEAKPPAAGPWLPLRTDRVKLYLNSPKVAGWNEIDAVALVGADGKNRWARTAHASSTYAERYDEPEILPEGRTAIVENAAERRLRDLEEQVKALAEQVQQLRAALGQPQPPK